MRKIRRIHTAVDEPMNGLVTFRALPNAALDQIDPFLLLNHHGPVEYPPGNSGLPFGPHPHRGFETVTFILSGDVMHADSTGGKSIIKAGGVQWMTAGSGLIHAEVSSDEFKRNGGIVNIIQIWLNLPAKLKMSPPKYIGLNKEEIPQIVINDGVIMNLAAGSLNNTEGAIHPLTDIFMSSIETNRGAEFNLNVSASRNILFYVVYGKIFINGEESAAHNLIEFENNGEEIAIDCIEDSILIFGHAVPYNEPVVASGPFVMNTKAEIYQAMIDYQSGKMGKWEE